MSHYRPPLTLPFFGNFNAMTCLSCGSTNESKLTAEIAIHFPGLKNLNKPIVWVFPEIVVCLDCGEARFAVPEAELRSLTRGDAATAR